ncbi:Asparagine synthetase domain-containing protein [Sulfidibacter corallicola]|uniref:asparagine synthase (glutamine-hydrolyzing) n=1 Tax=Sulfidibacter corallicola TaxID=2818388 RepID=A0A8A4TFT5_SULCO|nr:asparagine synthase-related protein [Sulfidibacter corallicola]QTD48387.1 hypothetical protein J3U87_22635 [Sulfidibacter corallicola]
MSCDPPRQQAPVTNFIVDPTTGDWCHQLDLAGAADPSAILHRLRGQFAIHQRDDQGGHWFARDPLGVNKLFFAVDDAGHVHSGNYLWDLVHAGIELARIWSVPSGYWAYLNVAQRTWRLERYSRLPYGGREAQPLTHLAGDVRKGLGDTFERLRTLCTGRRLFVTLSGGLDSSTIAVLTREWLGPFEGVTFSLGAEGRTVGEGEDLHFARRLARHLDVPLHEIHFEPDQLVSLLDPVLVRGQDWRDFNVHCGLVNAAIGAYLRERILQDTASDDEPPLLLTGDTMNELVADYSPVPYRGQTYYPLPRLKAGRLRRFLVAGLDSGDREVGIFHHFGCDTLQPYAHCAEVYTALPEPLLESDGAKSALARAVMGDRIPAEIYDRPKVRAQIGDSTQVGGTLAALVDRGVVGDDLHRRFCELFHTEPTAVDRLIHAGRYRVPTSFDLIFS